MYVCKCNDVDAGYDDNVDDKEFFMKECVSNTYLHNITEWK